MHNLEENCDGPPLHVDYDDAESQLVDCGSRLGVWWDRENPCFGIDHAGIASQREGKHFMAPLARLGVVDIDSGDMYFRGASKPSTGGHPWGFVQQGAGGGLRIAVTVVYASLDVVAVKVEIENTGRTRRHLRVTLDARSVPEDWNKKVVFHEVDKEIVTTQTSAPTSRFQIRAEPHIDIVTGWRTDFSIERPCVEPHGFSTKGEDFALSPGTTRIFSLFVSAASTDSGNDDRLIALVRKRLRDETLPVGEVIEAARRRWAEVFRALPADILRRRCAHALRTAPADTLATFAPALVHRAMMILLRNTIRAQPEQHYGQLMGEFRGTFPCRHSYEGFWAWDSAFHALGFAEWDLELAKDNIRLMLHNEARQEASEHWLPMLHADAAVPSAQPPLFSWVAMEIYEKERVKNPKGAAEFLEAIYPELALWNDWWFVHRDKNGNGLAEWGNNLESGWDDSPRWDNVDGSAGWNNDYGSALYEAVDLNAYLVKDLRCLGRMADALGWTAIARSCANRADDLAQRVVDVLYDPQDNLFYDTDYTTGARRKVLTPASFLPLWAGVPLPEQNVRRMIETYLLSPEHFFGVFPFPTVSYKDPFCDASGRSGYWRGPIWLNIAYFMIEVLASHGYVEEAREASRRILRMVVDSGIHENYCCSTGRRGPNSRRNFSWSAATTIAILMGDLTSGNLSLRHDHHFTSACVHIGVRVRDRKLYGRGKDAWIHLTNRTGKALSGTLRFGLPRGWGLRVHGGAPDPEDGWTDAQRGLPFQLESCSQEERPVCFVVPDVVDVSEEEYVIFVEAVSAGKPTVALGKTALRLKGPAMLPLPWLTKDTALALQDLLHEGDPFCFLHDGREIWRSKPGLIGILNSRLDLLGRQSLARHVGQRDLITHALHLLKNVAAADPLRKELEAWLAPGLNPQTAEEESRELLETVVQQTRDMTGRTP